MPGRIPQQFIDDLLDRLDIVEVIDRRVSLKKSGRNYMACCPFHDEKTPSFSVNQEKQFYYCFGCGAGGNAVGFLMDYERIDFPQAIEVLADTAGLEVPREATALQEEPQQKRNIYTILEKAADYFTLQLKEHPQRQRAIDYLKQRGLTGEIARNFAIGYAPPGWDNLLKTLGQNPEDKQLLIDGGMLIEKSEENKCYDRFRDRIMFPILDNRGRVVAFGGRVLGDDKPKYLNSPETPVFQKSRELYGLYQARKNNRQLSQLLIVEGYMDVVALSQCGISWAAATLGTATNTEHLKRVFRQTSDVIFCFDGDDAGRKAAARALDSALPVMEDGRQARFLFLPQGEDPDSLIRSIGATEFQRLIDQAKPLETHLFESLSEDLDSNSLEGKARLSTLAAPLINKLPPGVFKALMMASLAERTGLSQDTLTSLIHTSEQPVRSTAPKDHSKPAPAENSSATSARPKQRRSLPPTSEIYRDTTLYAIGLLILHPKLGPLVEPPTDNKELTSLDNKEPASLDNKELLLSNIIKLTHKRPDSTTYMLLGNWLEAPWKPLVEESLNQAQIFGVQGNADNPEQELLDTISHLQHQHAQQQRDQEIRHILSTHFNDQTPEQKQRLVQLLSEKHRQQ